MLFVKQTVVLLCNNFSNVIKNMITVNIKKKCPTYLDDLRNMSEHFLLSYDQSLNTLTLPSLILG